MQRFGTGSPSHQNSLCVRVLKSILMCPSVSALDNGEVFVVLCWRSGQCFLHRHRGNWTLLAHFLQGWSSSILYSFAPLFFCFDLLSTLYFLIHFTLSGWSFNSLFHSYLFFLSAFIRHLRQVSFSSLSTWLKHFCLNARHCDYHLPDIWLVSVSAGTTVCVRVVAAACTGGAVCDVHRLCLCAQGLAPTPTVKKQLLVLKARQ